MGRPGAAVRFQLPNKDAEIVPLKGCVMTIGIEHGLIVAIDDELQEQNRRLQETLRQYGVHAEPRPSLDSHRAGWP